MRILTRLAIAALAALVGCSAAEPTAEPDPTEEAVDMRKPKPPQPDMLPAPDDEVKPPEVEAPILVSTWMSVPIHGLADGAQVVLIEGTASGAVSADVASDGRFCAEVPLKPGVITNITLRAVNAIGKMSDPVQLAIRQQGAPPAPTPPPESQNASIGGSGSSSRIWRTHADESAILDGDDDTYFGGYHELFANYAQMTVRLADRSRIKQLAFKAPESCPFRATFEAYYSNADAPSNPHVDPIAWTKLAPSELTLDHATFNFSTPIVASHISILWDYEGFSGYNCGDWFNGPYYAVSEMEAWTAPNLPPPPPSPPTCSGGG